MIKIKYIGISNSINSSGIQYSKNVVYEVKEEVAEYFRKNFNSSFEIIEEKPKAEVEVEEAVVKTAPKPRAKRAVKPKAVEEEK